MKVWSIKLIKCAETTYIFMYIRLELQTPYIYHWWMDCTVRTSCSNCWSCQLACVYTGIRHTLCNLDLLPVALNCQEVWQHFRCINGTEDSCIIKRIFQPCIIIHSWQITICDLLHSNNEWILSLIGVNHFRPPPPPLKNAQGKKRKIKFLIIIWNTRIWEWTNQNGQVYQQY